MKMITPQQTSQPISAPYRPAPETLHHIQFTQTVILLVPLLWGLWQQRMDHPALLNTIGAAVAALTGAIFAGALITKMPGLRHARAGGLPGYLIEGLLLACILPFGCPWYLALLTSMAGLVIAALLRWLTRTWLVHGVIAARLLLELIVSPTASQPDSFLPHTLIRQLSGLTWNNTTPQLDIFMAGHLAPLDQIIHHFTSGPLGQTSALVLLVCGVYLIYRGYIHGALPALYLIAYLLGISFLPLPVSNARTIYYPLLAQGIETGLVFVSYHLFSSSIILCAFILVINPWCRPMTPSGQAVFGLLAGLLTATLCYYAPIHTPEFAALALTQLLTPLIDCLTRPHPGNAPA